MIYISTNHDNLHACMEVVKKLRGMLHEHPTFLTLLLDHFINHYAYTSTIELYSTLVNKEEILGFIKKIGYSTQ